MNGKMVCRNCERNVTLLWNGYCGHCQDVALQEDYGTALSNARRLVECLECKEYDTARELLDDVQTFLKTDE